MFKPVRSFLARRAVDAEFVHTTGRTSEAIAELAEQGDLDLLVMGSHGHGVLVNLVMGSVATRVLARCKSPVLLFR